MEQLMKGKILLVVGLGVGYVLGTRAGRARYEQMKKAASALWNDPRVQHQVNNAEDFVKDKAPDLAEFLAEQAKRVVSQASGGKKAPQAAPQQPRRTASASAGQPAAKKAPTTTPRSTAAKTSPPK
jgi:hypothetical protein